MTEARISIAELRKWLKKQDGHSPPLDDRDGAILLRGELRALVEAVEAAHTYLEADVFGVDRGALFLALLNAQDRFDFGCDS